MTTRTWTTRAAERRDVAGLLPLMRGLAEFEGYLDGFAITEQVLIEQGFDAEPPRFFARVADRDGEILGMLVYFFIPFTFRARPSLYIKELFVAPQWRGQGIGEALMRDVARVAMDAGCGAVTWHVVRWNVAGARFYEGLGAEPFDGWVSYSLTPAAARALL